MCVPVRMAAKQHIDCKSYSIRYVFGLFFTLKKQTILTIYMTALNRSIQRSAFKKRCKVFALSEDTEAKEMDFKLKAIYKRQCVERMLLPHKAVVSVNMMHSECEKL